MANTTTTNATSAVPSVTTEAKVLIPDWVLCKSEDGRESRVTMEEFFRMNGGETKQTRKQWVCMILSLEGRGFVDMDMDETPGEDWDSAVREVLTIPFDEDDWDNIVAYYADWYLKELPHIMNFILCGTATIRARDSEFFRIPDLL
jgi:hypothetical protein